VTVEFVSVLVGDAVIEGSPDSNDAGSAEAFRYTAATSGSVTALNVYIDTGSAASSVVVGLYSDSSGHPGTLLTSGTISSPSSGAWNSVNVTSVNVTSGTNYWIAVLGPTGTGTLNFRDKATGSLSQSSSQTNLSSLPASWSSGMTWASSSMSAYASTSTSMPDTTPPIVSISAPANNATVSGTTTVSANASDNVGVAGVQFKLDGANLGAEDTASPYSVSWNTAGVANGSHTLTAVARDTAGNTTTAMNVAVTVNNSAPDTTPPTVSMTAPTNGSTVSATITVSASAMDNVGVTSVQFKLDGANLGAADTTSPYSISWNTTTASNGSHTLTAVASDAAGNTTTSAGVTVTVSNGGAILFGDSAIESTDDATNSGTMDSYRYTNSVAGTVTRLSVYVPTTDAATRLLVGVYSDSSSRPASLLASCTIATVVKGAWNNCTLSTGLTISTSGTPYWISVLSPSGGGSETLRDDTSRGTNCWTSATSLSTLPASFGSATCGTGTSSVYASP
jgi:hypothetical protein